MTEVGGRWARWNFESRVLEGIDSKEGRSSVREHGSELEVKIQRGKGMNDSGVRDKTGKGWCNRMT